MRTQTRRIAEFAEPLVGPSEYTEAKVHPSVLEAELQEAGLQQRGSRELLAGIPLPAEAHFYSQYRWCLDACPALGDVLNHLSVELAKLDLVQEGWQQSEVITNIFLLACSITDTLDDYLLGDTYDFSKLEQCSPVAKPGAQILKNLLAVTGRLRGVRLSPLYQWKELWRNAVTEFLYHCFVVGVPERTTLIAQRNRLVRLLRIDLPKAAKIRRIKIPAFFRSRDFASHDCLELGRKIIASLPRDGRPTMVMGLRTAGSFLAPLLSAFLSKHSLNVDWIAVRPSKGLTTWEQQTLLRAAQKKARVLIVDESIHSGQTLAHTVELLRKSGIADEDVIVLNPAEPAYPEWRNSRILQSLPRISTIVLEPSERFKQQLLESVATVEAHLGAYFKAQGYIEAHVVTGPGNKQLNSQWREEHPERVDVRLKRIYEVRLKNSDGGSETRYVLAKSVGWGWLGYHAFIAAQELRGIVPPTLGLRDGILYTEWIAGAINLKESAPLDRSAVTESLARYIATRANNLQLNGNPTQDLVREARHKGFTLLASSLSRAHNSRVMAALDRPQIQRRLSEQGCPAAVMTDSKMSPEEWIVAGSRLLKTDFEHHAQGKNELGMTDPAYDLAGAIFHFGLSERESAQLVNAYVKQSGDIDVKDRLLLNKLLVGLWEQNLATLGLQNAKLIHRRDEFHQQYTAAWNFLVSEAIQQCGKLCQHPDEIRWKSPLVVTDIDGVLDRMVFGFPCATAAGIKAISLLHSHNFGVAVNTARSLPEVKQYCQAYGFAGGIAEYGAVIWDAVNHREVVLVTEQSLEQMEQVKKALRKIPGVFLIEDYQYSLRAVTYQNGRTGPLPAILMQDVLETLRAHGLRAHHTGLDTAVVAKETDKGTGLRHLLDRAGIQAEDTMAIGDSEPDLPMFRVAKSSFAPGHISCRTEARLLRCWIASLTYQPGLLQIAQKISHPQGDRCEHCQSLDETWRKDMSPNAKSLFLSLLSAADQTSLSSMLNKMSLSSVLALFRK